MNVHLLGMQVLASGFQWSTNGHFGFPDIVLRVNVPVRMFLCIHYFVWYKVTYLELGMRQGSGQLGELNNLLTEQEVIL